MNTVAAKLSNISCIMEVSENALRESCIYEDIKKIILFYNQTNNRANAISSLTQLAVKLGDDTTIQCGIERLIRYIESLK